MNNRINTHCISQSQINDIACLHRVFLYDLILRGMLCTAAVACHCVYARMVCGMYWGEQASCERNQNKPDDLCAPYHSATHPCHNDFHSHIHIHIHIILIITTALWIGPVLWINNSLTPVSSFLVSSGRVRVSPPP